MASPQTEMTERELAQQAELERLRAENESLKLADLKRQNKITSMKVSEKGALSVYGLGRFPITLYKRQWIKLAMLMGEVLEFIKIHDSELKDEK